MGKHRIIHPGDRFADLEILADAGLRVYCGENGRHWLCRCLLCGREIVVPQKNLGKAQKNCGCARRNPRKELPAGTRFGRLTVLEPVPADQPGGGLRYRLRCDCGKEVLATRANLMSGYVTSCGCLHDELFRASHRKYLDRVLVDGTTRTHMEHLDVMYANNTSGIRGVSWHRRRQKWQARIAYKGKTYSLGYYDDKEAAGEAVRQARARIKEDFDSKEDTP